MIVKITLQLSQSQYPAEVALIKALDGLKNAGHTIVEVEKNGKVDELVKDQLFVGDKTLLELEEEKTKQ